MQHPGLGDSHLSNRSPVVASVTPVSAVVPDRDGQRPHLRADPARLHAGNVLNLPVEEPPNPRHFKAGADGEDDATLSQNPHFSAAVLQILHFGGISPDPPHFHHMSSRKGRAVHLISEPFCVTYLWRSLLGALWASAILSGPGYVHICRLLRLLTYPDSTRASNLKKRAQGAWQPSTSHPTVRAMQVIQIISTSQKSRRCPAVPPGCLA